MELQDFESQLLRYEVNFVRERVSREFKDGLLLMLDFVEFNLNSIHRVVEKKVFLNSLPDMH